MYSIVKRGGDMMDAESMAVYAVDDASLVANTQLPPRSPKRVIKGQIIRVIVWRDRERRCDIHRFDVRAEDGTEYSIEATMSDNVARNATVYELVP